MAKFHMVQDQSYRDTISYFWSVKKILILMYPSRGWFSDKGSRIRPITTATPLLGLGHLQNQHSIVVQWRSHPHLWSHLWPHPHLGAGSRLEDGGNRQRLAFSWSASSTVRDASPHSNHFRCTISCKLEDYFCNDAWIRVSAVHTWSTYTCIKCMLLHVLHITSTYLLYPTAFLC